MVVPREGGRARFLALLGAFKVGKSFSSALWATGFAVVPNARVNLIGLEYDICEPEFSYLCEFLLSEKGMGLKATSLQNRPRDGKMWIDLENGCRYEARSWERKDTLKGKEIDAYLYCEAYMLPGIECFTGFSQNLRARQGYAVFTTTPDRPWVKELHEQAHGVDSEWHCTCSINAETNPFTFDARSKVRDEKLMTKEKFQIHYMGQLGDFVGRVFNYQRGQRVFTPASHSELFTEEGSTLDRDHFHLPVGWDVVGGADTGTFYTALNVAFSPSGDAFVIDEFPNYRYVAGMPERDEDITIPGWASTVVVKSQAVGARPAFWADANSQFKTELRNYGITILADRSMKEQRTEIAREYFQHCRIWLAPWLRVLPFELENAAWPEETSASGRYERVKDKDHTLDCLEHILVRRPLGRGVATGPQFTTWAQSAGLKQLHKGGNAHLGRQ